MLRELSSTPKTTASGESGDVDRGRGPADDGETILTSASKKRTRRRKPTRYISKRQAMNLMEALKFASLIGFPLNVCVDIAWVFFSGTVDDRTRFARCQQRLSKWTKRLGFPLTLIWTREVGKHGSASGAVFRAKFTSGLM
jgi:hypothetical protein